MLCFLRRLIRALSGPGLCLLLSIVATASIADEQRVLVLGDSISAAYGMDLEQSWVALLDQRFEDRGLPYRAVNASISGDTTGGGLRRLPKLLTQHAPAVVIIELGGNDGLRGYPISQLRDNLLEMVTRAQKAGARVLLLPMEVPPNLGPRYSALFRDSFTSIAESTGAAVSGFLLEGIALNPALMQDDGIHPTVAAQPQLLANVWPHLTPLLD